MLELPGVRVVLDPTAMVLDDADRAYLESPINAVRRRNFNAIEDAMRRSDGPAQKELHLRFFASPVEIEDADRVAGVRFVRNRPEAATEIEGARSGGERFSIQAGLAVSCIGFSGRPCEACPFDEKRGIVPVLKDAFPVPRNRARRSSPPAGSSVAPAESSARTGPDAAETVRAMLADFRDGRWPVRTGATRPNPGFRNAVDFAGWKRIDQSEQSAGQKSGRPRRKVVTVEEMIGISVREADGPNRDEGTA